MLRVTLFFLCSFVFSNLCHAQIVFKFDNQTTTLGAGLDGKAGGVFTVNGLEMTITANTGVFNATSSDFGINQSASGDDTDGFDFEQSGGPGVSEGFTFSFDKDVLLVNFGVSNFNAGDDEITLTSSGNQIATIDQTGSTDLNDFFVLAGTDIQVLTTGGDYGNGWSLDSFSVTAVPEPASIGILCALGGGFLVRRRYLSKMKNAEENTAKA